MKALITGLLMACVPVCFAQASKQFTPVESKMQPVKIHTQSHSEQPAPRISPQTQVTKTTVVHSSTKKAPKKVQPKKKSQPIQTVQSAQPVVIERHYYYEDGQPRRVVVRKHIQGSAPRIVHHERRLYPNSTRRVYEYDEYYEPAPMVVTPAPRVIVGPPAPALSFGISFP